MFQNPGGLPPSRNAEERRRIIEMGSKTDVELKNPCLKEHKLSMKCLSDHNYDHDACQTVFANYVCCKKFWTHVQQDRRRKGLYPLLPKPEDREQIKKEYMESNPP